jgi:pyrrolysine biosynthesis protein PylC
MGRNQVRRMLVAIAGGALQGLEMTYLAKQAGFDTLLMDRNREAPATGLCDRFVAVDLTDHEALTRALGSVDLVLPATENVDALRSLVVWCAGNRKPLAFDPGAYTISSSKKKSDALFKELGIPAPTPWPNCAFPVLAKPDSESGSKEVEVFSDLSALEARFDIIPPPGRVLQAYVTGPSYSIEVVGRPGDYAPLQITDLEMDEDYDCKRVLAPSTLPSDLKGQFERIAVTLAEAVGLSGIMDVEAILHEGRLEVLEIDARFPSQTPIAVYHSTGINMLERLAKIFTDPDKAKLDSVPVRPAGGSVLEHIRVRDGKLDVCGEHIMVEDGPLHLEPNFFGADAALTSYASGKPHWVATLMVKGSDLEAARERRNQVVGEIRNRFGLNIYSDDYPQERFNETR